MTAALVPKLCGADVELGNFVLGGSDAGDSAREASQALLDEIGSLGAVPAARADVESRAHDPRDRSRLFLPENGACAYIDLDHLEICLPEVVSAYDHVACWHAMLRLVQRAQASANAQRDPARPIQVLANNSDGHGRSYGAHLNVLVSRQAFEHTLERKPHYLAYLASFQASSLLFTGQGKVGSENGRPPVDFQLSQRADFFETVAGIQTTSRRPLVNTRDEALCGRSELRNRDLARMHVIFFDSTLCEVATLLRVGTMQIVLAMLEAGLVDSRLALDDPVAAAHTWSHDPSLRATSTLVSGQAITAVELQRRFCDQAECFVSTSEAPRVVPRAGEILALWNDTLHKLEARDWSALARRLDWVLKRLLLTRAMQQRPELRWDSPEIKHLDHLYSSLDPAAGLYWSLSRNGNVDRVVTDEEIARFTTDPPRDTRARVRAMLLRRAGHALDEVDWDIVRLTAIDGHGYAERWRIDLPDPFDRGPWPDDAWPATSIAELARLLGGTRLYVTPSYADGRWPATGPVLTSMGRLERPAHFSSLEWSREASRGSGGSDGSP
jgi:proteasome accessory factor A